MSTNKAKRDDIRQIISSLLLARKGATAVPMLDNDYYHAEKKRIPWRQFGYASLVEFLESMPEHFIIEFRNGVHFVRGIASEKTRHVSSLVSRQRQNSMKHIPLRSQNRHPVNYHVPRMVQQRRIPAEHLNSLVQYVRNYPSGISMQTAMLLIQRQLPHVILSVHDVRQQLRELTHQIYMDGEMIRPVESKNSDACREINHQPLLPQSDVARATAEYAYGVPGDESDINDCDYNADFVPAGYVDHNTKGSKTGKRIAMSFNGGQTLDHHDSNNDNNNVECTTDTERTEYYERNGMSTLISGRTRLRLEELMRKNPDGIWCTELPEKYVKEYNVPLNYSDLGFNSVREYVAYLPEIFYMTRHTANDDFILFSADMRPKDQELSKSYIQKLSSKHVHETASRTEQVQNINGPYDLYDEDDDDIAPFPSNVSPTLFAKFAPDGVMAYDESVDHILVTDLQRTRKQFLEIYVVEVFTPSFFWVHLRRNRKHLDALMEDLRNFYEQNSKTYTIPKFALKRGLNCACLYANIWHRGIVKTVKPDFRVTVMFYDYGTLKTYAPEDVYYLHKQFSYLPAQAIPCGLYNVRPNVGDRWKKSITDRFIDRISDSLLAATIINIDPPNNSMLVILTDTSEEEDVHINDWLVREKLAQCGKMGDAVDMANIMNYVVNHLNQLPTYCYAEENLIADSRNKATFTEEFVEMPTFSPGQSFVHCNNNSQPRLKPSSGVEHTSLSNTSANDFNADGYSVLGSASNIKASSFGNTTETATNNPFLFEDTPQPVIEVDFNEATKKLFMQIWHENMQLQIKLLEMFRDTLKHSPTCKFMLNNNLAVQYHFNRIFKIFEQALIVDKNEAIIASNLSRSEATNNIGAQNTVFKSNGENFTSQKIIESMSNFLATINPFSDFCKPIQTAHNLTSDLPYMTYTYDITQSACRDGINWNQTDESSSYVQVPPATLGPSPLAPTNYESTSSTMSAVSTADMSSVSRCPPGFFQNINTEFANVHSQQNKDPSIRKETNPFKLSLANEFQISHTQSEHTTGYDTTISTSYFPDRNLQNYSPKMEFATNYNPHRIYESLPISESRSGFVPMGPTETSGSTAAMGPTTAVGPTGATEPTGAMGPTSININRDDNYTPRIVYESGPVMYNTQKKKAEADITNQSYSCGDYSDDTAQSCLRSGQYNKKEQPPQPVKYIDINHVEYNNNIPHFVQNVSSALTDNSILNNESYVTTTLPLQNSLPTIKSETNYQQHNQAVNANEPQFSEATLVGATCQNMSSLQKHRNPNCSPMMTNPSPYREWSFHNGNEVLTRNMNGTINPTHVSQFDSVNNENAMVMYANLWSLFFTEEQKSTDHKNVSSYTHNTSLNTGFSFHRIDSVKGVTIIFHMEGNGWILIPEFAEAFTNIKSCPHLISILEMMNLTTVLKNIQRSDYPVQFLQLDSYPLRAARDSKHRITTINLISLPHVLVLLCKLRIISPKEIENALRKNEYTEGSVMHNVWMLISAYKAFTQRIGQYNISYRT